MQTKKSLGYYKGDHLPIDKSRKLLREAAKKAVRSAKNRKPVTLKGPVCIEVDVSSDAINDPALAQRQHDNISFTDGAFSGPNVLSDFEHIMRNNPDLSSPRDGTISIETDNFKDGYLKLFKVLGDIYERDIENLVDIVAEVDAYERPDINNILGDDYPLNELGPRR